MRRLGPALLVMLFGASVHAGCATGSQDGVDDVPFDPDASAGPTPQSPPPGDDAALVAEDTGSPALAADAADDSSASLDASASDSAAGDAATPDAGAADSAPSDAAADAGVPDAADAGAMSPALGLPSPTGAVCKDIGQDIDCPFGDVCRIDSPSTGRCEACTTCRGHHRACTESADCLPPYQCYAGLCSDICRLGSHQCGSSATCTNVGNAKFGICQ